jgi:hypothetical protein
MLQGALVAEEHGSSVPDDSAHGLRMGRPIERAKTLGAEDEWLTHEQRNPHVRELLVQGVVGHQGGPAGVEDDVRFVV